MDELFRSSDCRITVERTDDVVSLRFNGRLQSSVRGPEGLDAAQRYLDFLHLPLAISDDPTNVLVVGLGGGVVPKRMLHDYPHMLVDVVELDSQVVELAHRFFGLPTDDRLRVIIGDGRQYLETTDECYDVIIIDAYHETSMPFPLTTLEFVRLAASRLKPRGALEYNMVGVLESEELRSRIRDRVGGRVLVPGFDSFSERLAEELPLRNVRPILDSEMPDDGMLHA